MLFILFFVESLFLIMERGAVVIDIVPHRNRKPTRSSLGPPIATNQYLKIRMDIPNR